MEIDDKAALRAAFQLGIDVNLEFIKQKTKRGPLFLVMAFARRDMIEALKRLPHVDPADTEGVRKLQNEVQRFLDLCAYVRKIFIESDEAAQQLTALEADELREAIAAEGGEIPGADE